MLSHTLFLFVLFQKPDSVSDADNCLRRGKDYHGSFGMFRSKYAHGIDCRMGNDAGENALTNIENRGIAKSDGGSIDKLENRIKNRSTAEQIHDMSDAESQGRNDDCGF